MQFNKQKFACTFTGMLSSLKEHDIWIDSESRRGKVFSDTFKIFLISLFEGLHAIIRAGVKFYHSNGDSIVFCSTDKEGLKHPMLINLWDSEDFGKGKEVDTKLKECIIWRQLSVLLDEMVDRMLKDNKGNNLHPEVNFLIYVLEDIPVNGMKKEFFTKQPALVSSMKKLRFIKRVRDEIHEGKALTFEEDKFLVVVSSDWVTVMRKNARLQSIFDFEEKHPGYYTVECDKLIFFVRNSHEHVILVPINKDATVKLDVYFDGHFLTFVTFVYYTYHLGHNTWSWVVEKWEAAKAAEAEETAEAVEPA